MLEKKIFLEKNHDLDFVVGKIIESTSDKVIVNIPRDSVLGRTVHNFQVLKREAATAGKEILIESVDDHVLELSSVVGISAINPVFRKAERAVSDILPRTNLKRRITDVADFIDSDSVVHTKKTSRKKELKDENIEVRLNDEDSKDLEPLIFEPESEPRKEKRKLPRKRLTVILIAVLLFVATVLTGTTIMPRARVNITLKKIPIDFDDLVSVSSKASGVSIANEIIVPGELLIAEKNIARSFPASKKERVEVKATGRLTVYNGYSSQSQLLVASTRFESPDKKIFRIMKAVTIPGAKIQDGKIVPSKIEVDVTADVPGDSSNIAPVSGWRIPGFAGSPRYEGFYAESFSPMTGGFVGERAVPTEEDLIKARAELSSVLREALQGEMTVVMRDSFMFFEDAESWKILEEKVGGEEENEFSLFLKGELRRIIYETKTLEDALALKARRGLPEGLRYRDFKAEYGSREFNFLEGKMKFKAKGSLVFETDVKAEEVREEIKGKDEAELQSLVFALPGLEKATISLWPFWVKRVPEKTAKIKVNIE